MASTLGDEVREVGIVIRFVGVVEVITILSTFFKQTIEAFCGLGMRCGF